VTLTTPPNGEHTTTRVPNLSATVKTSFSGEGLWAVEGGRVFHLNGKYRWIQIKTLLEY